MKIKSACMAIFSPTDSTRKIVERIGGYLSPTPTEMNLTLPASSRAELHFLANDLVIFGVPVYGGRVPETARERFKILKGHRTPAVIVVTYGNRAYDDALLELKTVVEEQGFQVIAAAAFVTEHNIVRQIAAGRPDENDLKAIDRFGAAVARKVAEGAPSAWHEIGVPGNKEYRPYQPIPMHPKTGSGCNHCGICSRECPAGAIPADDPRQTDASRCISCMRCTRVCPAGARKLPWLLQWGAKRKIMPKCRERREAEVFI